MRTIYNFMVFFLTFALLLGNALAEEPSLISGSEFKPNQTDSSIDISFSAPAAHIENLEIAQKNGLVKFYQVPPSDGKPSLSAFTVVFQKKSENLGMRNLTEFINVDLKWFKDMFPNSMIAKINIKGIIDKKFKSLGFPYELFMFQGNLDSRSIDGDSLTLFFETSDGYWSIVWSVPQPAIKIGLPVFEGFINDLIVKKRPY